jgi:hypothetical protein
MTIPIVVTRHAVRRYLERVMHVDLSAYDRLGMSDSLAVDLACERHSIDAAYIEAQITLDVEPRVPETVRLRGTARTVRGEICRYVIEGRYVVTTLPERGDAAA